MISIELRNSTALGNRLTGLSHNKEGFSGGKFHLHFPTNTATISNVWCLKICAGTLFLMLLKFGAVLSIICGFLMAVLYLDQFTAMYCCHAVIAEDAKTTLASGPQTWSLERESTQFYGVLDHGLNVHWNNPLIRQYTLLTHLWHSVRNPCCTARPKSNEGFD